MMEEVKNKVEDTERRVEEESPSEGASAAPSTSEGGAKTARAKETQVGEAKLAEAPEEGASSASEAKSEPDWKTLYALTLADFDNYKKRAARDREDTYRYAEGDILKDILPVVDNLALALANAKDKEDSFVKGVQLVYDNLLKSLKDHGAEPFDSVGLALDTEKMEAIATLPSEEIEEGKVSIESKKGWMLKGKVLRAAQVVVSSGKPE